jgi:hypothetical protein
MRFLYTILDEKRKSERKRFLNRVLPKSLIEPLDKIFSEVVYSDDGIDASCCTKKYCVVPYICERNVRPPNERLVMFTFDRDLFCIENAHLSITPEQKKEYMSGDLTGKKLLSLMKSENVILEEKIYQNGKHSHIVQKENIEMGVFLEPSLHLEYVIYSGGYADANSNSAVISFHKTGSKKPQGTYSMRLIAHELAETLLKKECKNKCLSNSLEKSFCDECKSSLEKYIGV